MNSGSDLDIWRRLLEDIRGPHGELANPITKEQPRRVCMDDSSDELADETISHVLEAISTIERNQPGITAKELLAELKTLSVKTRANANGGCWQLIDRFKRRYVLARSPTQNSKNPSVEGLIRRGQGLGLLSADDCVLLGERQVITADAEGNLRIHTPNSRVFRYVGISIAIMLAGCACWVFSILSDALPLEQAMIWSLPLGYLFGMLLRKRWDSAWGHKKLAEKLSALFGGAWVTYRNPH